MEGTTVCT